MPLGLLEPALNSNRELSAGSNKPRIRWTNWKICSKINQTSKTERKVNLAIEEKDNRIKIDFHITKDLKAYRNREGSTNKYNNSIISTEQTV